MFFLLVVKNGSILKQKVLKLKKTATCYSLTYISNVTLFSTSCKKKNLPRLPEDLPGIQAPLFKETEPFF